MLYLIGTTRDGRVVELTACPDGVDQALDIVTGHLTHPEEDPLVTLDGLGLGLAGQWTKTCARFPNDGAGCCAATVFTRRGHEVRYGLATTPGGDEPEAVRGG